MLAIDIFLIVIAFIWIISAIIFDLKTREIPNWLNFSLVIFALGGRAFYSLFYNDWNFLIQGIFGFAVFFSLENILYYSRFFAGGDAKLMMGLGPIIPFEMDFLGNAGLFLNFLFLFMAAAALFGFFSVLYFTYNDFNRIKKDFLENLNKNKKIFYALMIFGLIVIIAGFWFEFLFLFGALIFILPSLLFYTKSIDNVCLVRRIKTSELTEGDWLYSRIKAGKQVIMPRWEGVSKREIRLIRKKHKFVVIRRGIEFSPVFLVSFAAFVFFYLSGINLWDFFGHSF